MLRDVVQINLLVFLGIGSKQYSKVLDISFASTLITQLW